MEREETDTGSKVLTRQFTKLVETNKNLQVELLCRDGLVSKFLRCQESFEGKGIPSLATIAYHYTAPHSLDSIKEKGLLTPNDQRSQSITSGRINRLGTYGSGIYLGVDPISFNGHALCGIMVAVVFGKMHRVQSHPLSQEGPCNTFVGNVGHPQDETVGQDFDQYVVRESCQCLPLLKFEATFAVQNGSETLWQLHQRAQAILDQVANRGQATKLVRVIPLYPGRKNGFLGGVSSDQQRHLPPARRSTRSSATRPRGTRAKKSKRCDASDGVVTNPEEFYSPAPKRRCTLMGFCCICREELMSQAVEVQVCHHKFHEKCLKNVLVNSGEQTPCPVCHVPLKGRRRSRRIAGLVP